MSNQPNEGTTEVDDDEQNQIVNKYVPPKNVPISEIWNKDADDAALVKYKQALIGGAINVIIGKRRVTPQHQQLYYFVAILSIFYLCVSWCAKEPTDPRKLLLKRLVLVPDDFAEISIDLKGDLDRYKDQVFKLKEGCQYRIKLEFYVQRDIICGLKFVQAAYKGPIRSKQQQSHKSKDFFADETTTMHCHDYHVISL